MQINLATIEQHADEKLRRIEAQPAGAERLAALRKFLKIETQRLHLRHRFGISGTEIVRARSLIVDLLIQRLAPAAATAGEGRRGEGLAIIALGGYGRQELAPHSDIDLLFLHHSRRDEAAAQELSEAILYLLWDVGFTVGHSLRTLRECIAIAKEDSTSRTALVDARLLWGSSRLFDNLASRLEEDVFKTQGRTLLDELMSERASRYAKFGDVVCLQEPNIKETAGGLRDLHTLFWAGRIAYGHATLPKLAASHLISEREAKALNTAYDFLLRVRNQLHFQTGRRTD
jgi:[protein-PII] uridylyltransferase